MTPIERDRATLRGLRYKSSGHFFNARKIIDGVHRVIDRHGMRLTEMYATAHTTGFGDDGSLSLGWRSVVADDWLWFGVKSELVDTYIVYQDRYAAMMSWETALHLPIEFQTLMGTFSRLINYSPETT